MRKYLEKKTFLEINAVENKADEIAKTGKRACIVTGKRSSKVNGSLDDMKNVLEKNNIPYIIVDYIEENPSVESVVKASKESADFGADFYIGIGGGSPLDASKAISFLAFNKKYDKDFLFNNDNAEYFPVISVPTTCGTGSEATGVAVLSRNDMETKQSMARKIYPSLALMDPKYLSYASENVLKNTAIDACGHLIESYINTLATNESREYVKTGLNIWSKGKDVIKGKIKIKPKDEEYYDILKNMLLASNYGGRAIAVTGTSICHALSYKLTYKGGVPHGRAIGVYEPGFIKYADKEDRDFIIGNMDFKNLEEFEEFIYTNLPVNTINKQEFEEINRESAEIFMSNESRIKKVPYHLDKDVLNGIAESALNACK